MWVARSRIDKNNYCSPVTILYVLFTASNMGEWDKGSRVVSRSVQSRLQNILVSVPSIDSYLVPILFEPLNSNCLGSCHCVWAPMPGCSKRADSKLDIDGSATCGAPQRDWKISQAGSLQQAAMIGDALATWGSSPWDDEVLVPGIWGYVHTKVFSKPLFLSPRKQIKGFESTLAFSTIHTRRWKTISMTRGGGGGGVKGGDDIEHEAWNFRSLPR